jgi:TraC-like protein
MRPGNAEWPFGADILKANLARVSIERIIAPFGHAALINCYFRDNQSNSAIQIKQQRRRGDMARQITRTAIDDQIAALKAKRDEIVRREQAALGRAAERAGILELGLSEAELLEAFRGVVATFRANTAERTVSARPATRRTQVAAVVHAE